MDEYSLRLQFGYPGPDVQSLKSPNSIFDLFGKRPVDTVENNHFFPDNDVDFNQLTFFHPGDYDDEPEAPPDVPAKGEKSKIHPGSKSYFSEPALREISNLFLKAPLETSTAVQDSSPASTFLGGVSNSTASHENASSLSQPSNSSTTGWSGEEIGAVFVICLMVPFIICSNLFVIVSIIRFRRLHTPTNYFITSLAAVDIVVALATPLAIAVQLFQYGGGDAAHDTVLCLLPNRILMMACGVSLLTLATIAYDRHTALINPLEYINIMTSRKVAIMLTISWLYSMVIVWFPITIGWYDVMTPASSCSSDHLHPTVHVLFFVAVFAPSCTVIMICYTRIFLVARHHARAIAAVEFAVHRRLQARFIQKDTKYAKTLALVIGAFLLLWLPHLIYTFIKTFNEITINIWLETYLILLAVLNSGLNPWIYAFKNNEFRAAFKRMFKDYCRFKICNVEERRKSLMSGSSVTPRMSRTDSRMVSTILDPTMTLQGQDKISSALNFLDNYDVEADLAKCTLNDPDENQNEVMAQEDNVQPEVEIEGHINWAHDEDESMVPAYTADDTRYFPTNVTPSVARNQSFTLGLHHVCLEREFQKSTFDQQLCQCRQSKVNVFRNLKRSTTSVSPVAKTSWSPGPRLDVLRQLHPANTPLPAFVFTSSFQSTNVAKKKAPFPPSITISPASPPLEERSPHPRDNLAHHVTRHRAGHRLLNKLKENANCSLVKSEKNSFLNDSFDSDSRMSLQLFPSPQDSPTNESCPTLQS